MSPLQRAYLDFVKQYIDDGGKMDKAMGRAWLMQKNEEARYIKHKSKGKGKK